MMDENTQEIQQAAQPGLDMDDFDAGFNDGVVKGQEATVPVESSEQPVPEQMPEQTLPDQEAQHQPPASEQVQPVEPVAPVAPVSQVAPVASVAPVTSVEIDAALVDEFDELTRLSPRAAELAKENSPEGAAIRDRLERLGADSAFDRAEVLLERRERAAQAANAQQQAIEAHNRNFQQVLRTEHPDLFAPTRTQEQNQQLMADMRTWIEGKPYVEARGLMDIYEDGRDPRQVAALLTRFKQETQTGATGSKSKHIADHTAALAVTGRGAPVVPKTFGDKDDFEAGWNL